MTDAHDPMVVGAGRGLALERVVHTSESEQDTQFLYNLFEFNNMYGFRTRQPFVDKQELSLRALYMAVQECQVCLCLCARGLLCSALNGCLCAGLRQRGDGQEMDAYCVCTWLRRRTPLGAVSDQVRNDVEKHACVSQDLIGEMCRSNYVKLLYAYEVYRTTGKKMTVEERAQFTCSKLSLSVVSMRDRKIVENMRQREARNGMAAATAQWHRTAGSGLEGRMLPTLADADAMRLAAEIFGPTVHLQTTATTYSRQERTAGVTTTEGEAGEDDKNVRASSAKAPLPVAASTGGGVCTSSALSSSARSFGYSSAKAPLPVAASTQGSSCTLEVFGTGAARVEAPRTALISASLGTARVVTSAPASAAVSSAKVADVQTSFTGIKLTTSRVVTSAPALPPQANETASPVQGSKFIVKFRLSELPDYRGLKKKLKLQHKERTSLPPNGASFSDVLVNTLALQATLSQPFAENTQALLPIKREEVEDDKQAF